MEINSNVLQLRLLELLKNLFLMRHDYKRAEDSREEAKPRLDEAPPDVRVDVGQCITRAPKGASQEEGSHTRAS